MRARRSLARPKSSSPRLWRRPPRSLKAADKRLKELTAENAALSKDATDARDELATVRAKADASDAMIAELNAKVQAADADVAAAKERATAAEAATAAAAEQVDFAEEKA